MLAFLAGLVSTGAILAPAVFPAQVYGAWCRARYGAEPSAQGIVLTLRSAESVVRGPAGGPWVQLEFLNIGREPAVLMVPERLGGELGFRATGPDGLRVAQRSGPAAATVPGRIRRHVLAPGERLGLVCDLSRWLIFPSGEAVYAVQADRAPLARDGVRCRSNTLRLRVK